MHGGLLELGEIVLTASERRLEVSARNVANISTPGYKREISFEQTLAGAEPQSPASYVDMSAGVSNLTGRRFDLSLAGAGFFAVASEQHVYYTRGGQFERAADGRLLNAQGLALQSDEGGDVIVRSQTPEITEDGTVLEDGLPTARIGVFQAADGRVQSFDGALFSAPDESMDADPAPRMRQGALEGANVDLSAEMIGMVGTLRQAEAGARIVQTYDALIGQAISNLGRATR